jgi:hypothetical protein
VEGDDVLRGAYDLRDSDFISPYFKNINRKDKWNFVVCPMPHWVKGCLCDTQILSLAREC